MSSKIINMHSDFFANLVVDAANLVKFTDPKVSAAHMPNHVVNCAFVGYRAVSDQVDQHPEGERQKREGNAADQRIRAQLHSRLATNAQKGDPSQNRLPRLLASKGEDEDGRPCHRRRPREAARYDIVHIFKQCYVKIGLVSSRPLLVGQIYFGEICPVVT